MDVREDDLGFDYEMEINEESCKIAKDHDENSIAVRWFLRIFKLFIKLFYST